MSDRPAGRPVPTPARVSARKRAYTDDGTNGGTNTKRNERRAAMVTGAPGWQTLTAAPERGSGEGFAPR